MSGGSYNYLCYRGPQDFAAEDLVAMRDRLIELGYKELADQTGEILLMLGKIEHRMNELSEVWHAVEWMDSGDYTEQQTIEELNEASLKLTNVPPDKKQ